MQSHGKKISKSVEKNIFYVIIYDTFFFFRCTGIIDTEGQRLNARYVVMETSFASKELLPSATEDQRWEKQADLSLQPKRGFVLLLIHTLIYKHGCFLVLDCSYLCDYSITQNLKDIHTRILQLNRSAFISEVFGHVTGETCSMPWESRVLHPCSK